MELLSDRLILPAIDTSALQEGASVYAVNHPQTHEMQNIIMMGLADAIDEPGFKNPHFSFPTP